MYFNSSYSILTTRSQLLCAIPYKHFSASPLGGINKRLFGLMKLKNKLNQLNYQNVLFAVIYL